MYLDKIIILASQVGSLEIERMKKVKISFDDMDIGEIQDAEFIPIMADEDEDAIDKLEIGNTLPLLPLRNMVLFPGVVLPITVGRKSSLELVKEVYKQKGLFGAIAQTNPRKDHPVITDLHKIGTVAQIVKILEMPDGNTTVIIQGKKRFQLEDVINYEPYHVAKITPLQDIRPDKESVQVTALITALKETATKIIKLSPQIPNEVTFAVKNIETPTFLVNFICTNANLSLEEKQELLSTEDVQKRATSLLEKLVKELQMLEIKNDIQSKVQTGINQQQREYYLHQQIRTIQDELGGSPAEKDIEELLKKERKKKWGKSVKKVFKKELKKLQRLNTSSPEYSVQLTYLQELTDLPWNEFTKDNFDLHNAQSTLDNDHYGLDKVKERIIEHLAVLKLKGDLKSPIICLHGPPGVGKTSLGKSIANALNRKYVRMSLGGIHDESEIRGHRRTYIGAMPGRIIRNLKKAGSSNPVFILDEIDKVKNDFRGDPSSALLEVLDPEQNNAFHDNYLDIDYDLSQVLFVATANNIGSIAAPLRDRMELIDISGYILEEKIEIGKKHLLPKQLKNHGLSSQHLKITAPCWQRLVEDYTKESGVRGLDKTIAKVVRKTALKVAKEEPYDITLKPEQLKEILGIPRFSKELYEGNDYAGVVTGLAWTALGGEILFIESSLSQGKGKLTLTGNLGDVMKESAVLALEYLRSHADILELKAEDFDKWNIHLHVPEGAIPKDGPSAGITMFTSLASAISRRKVRKNLAMTGEITLRGKVLPVGGIKEKILAAKRAGIKEIILSKENKKNIEEINDKYLKGIKFYYVESVAEVMKIALLKEKATR